MHGLRSFAKENRTKEKSEGPHEGKRTKQKPVPGRPATVLAPCRLVRLIASVWELNGLSREIGAWLPHNYNYSIFPPFINV